MVAVTLSYDLRTPARLLSAIQTHGNPVVSILLQPGSVGNLVVTGSSSGGVHFCDLRNGKTILHGECFWENQSRCRTSLE